MKMKSLLKYYMVLHKWHLELIDTTDPKLQPPKRCTCDCNINTLPYLEYKLIFQWNTAFKQFS